MTNRALRIPIAVLSVLLMIASAMADRIFPSASPGAGPWQLAAIVMSAALLLLSFFAGRRFLTRTLPIITANTVLLLIVLDGAAILAERRLATSGRGIVQPQVVEIPALEEFYQPPPGCFYPYVLLRSRPSYRERGVTTDSLGFRRTPYEVEDAEAIAVHLYGGSTVLGWGLPDSLTLAALLQRELRGQSDLPVNVSNRGIATRNSTQSMIEFVLALQAGDVPDAAVFYEGYNDGATAWFEGDAASHLGARRMQRIFCEGAVDNAEGSGLLNRAALFRVVRLLASDRTVVPELVDEAVPLGRRMDPEALAAETMDIFEENCRLIRSIAGEFGVPVVVAWQPSLAPEIKPLSTEEERFLQEMDRGKVEFQRVLWDSARARSMNGEYQWLGDINRGVERPVYNDYCHMNSYGTAIVAESLAVLVVPELPVAPDSGVGGSG